MTVSDYQKVYDITESTDIDDVERMAWVTCHVLGYKPAKVDKFSKLQFLKAMDKVKKRLNKVTTPLLFHPEINTDATKITFGQFVEVVHWMKGGVIEQMHMIFASMLNDGNHKDQSQKVLKLNVRKVLPFVVEFMQSFNELMGRYSKLFEADKPEEGEKPLPPHPFIQQYGWIFSATQLAKHNGIPLNDVYKLPIIQALNDLAFLKSLNAYEKYQANGK